MALAAAAAWADLLLGRIPGWPEAAGAALVVGALAVAAARLGSGGFVAAATRGPGGAPKVALTFDDGPDPATTPRVLDALAAAGVHATFFLVGGKAAAQPALVRRIAAEGHEIGSHGLDHRWQSLLTPARARSALREAAAAIARITGTAPELFRPPYGVMTPALARAVRDAGVRVVGWTVRSWDTMSREAPAARAAAVAARAGPGAILLLHDAAERPAGRVPLGPEMVGPLVAALRARGLSPVTVSELLAPEPQATVRRG